MPDLTLARRLTDAARENGWAVNIRTIHLYGWRTEMEFARREGDAVIFVGVQLTRSGKGIRLADWRNGKPGGYDLTGRPAHVMTWLSDEPGQHTWAPMPGTRRARRTP